MKGVYMSQYFDKDALIAEIDRRMSNLSPKRGQGMIVTKILKDHYKNLRNFINTLRCIYMTQEDKENIIYWFEHIAQIANDRKTANGVVMEDSAALDEIRAIAKGSIYYIKNHCL